MLGLSGVRASGGSTQGAGKSIRKRSAPKRRKELIAEWLNCGSAVRLFVALNEAKIDLGPLTECVLSHAQELVDCRCLETLQELRAKAEKKVFKKERKRRARLRKLRDKGFLEDLESEELRPLTTAEKKEMALLSLKLHPVERAMLAKDPYEKLVYCARFLGEKIICEVIRSFFPEPPGDRIPGSEEGIILKKRGRVGKVAWPNKIRGVVLPPDKDLFFFD